MPFVKAVANSDPNLPFDQQMDLPVEIRNAVICCHGKLTPKYEYITGLRLIREKEKKPSNLQKKAKMLRIAFRAFCLK
jgi:hypothetical protein